MSSLTDKNIVWQEHTISKKKRAKIKNQKPCIVWLTGFSGSGKSTIANALEVKLHSLGYHTYLLDGDNVRHGLNKDLGFSEEDRVENIRRIAEVAKLFMDSGTITITAFISPFVADRELARGLVEKDEFIEVFVDTSLAICEQRDPKGLYKKARKGEIKNFTGIDSPYERPTKAEINLKNDKMPVEESVKIIIEYLKNSGYIK